MPHIITSDIARLELHDSTIENISRDKQQMELIFDWAALVNFAEAGINELIILGKTTMRLTGVASEKFDVCLDNETFVARPFPDNFPKYFDAIGAGEIDDSKKTVKISSLFNENGQGVYNWVEWSFGFDTCEVSWTSHITKTEWQKGKLPSD